MRWREWLGIAVMVVGFVIAGRGFKAFAASKDDDAMYQGVWAFLGGCVVLGVGIQLSRMGHAHHVQQLVRSLNPLQGKKYRFLLRQFGNPQVVEQLPDGSSQCTWVLAGRNLSLVFDPDGICTRVSREQLTSV